jgi:hypothetical protein
LGIDEANAAKVLAAATCIVSTKPMAEYLDEAGAALHLKSSRRRLKDLRTRGNGPLYLRLGGCVRYRRDWLDSWAANNAVLSTAEETVRCVKLAQRPSGDRPNRTHAQS